MVVQADAGGNHFLRPGTIVGVVSKPGRQQGGGGMLVREEEEEDDDDDERGRRDRTRDDRKNDGGGVRQARIAPSIQKEMVGCYCGLGWCGFGKCPLHVWQIIRASRHGQHEVCA